MDADGDNNSAPIKLTNLQIKKDEIIIDLNKIEYTSITSSDESEVEDLYPDNKIEPEFQIASKRIDLSFPEYIEFGKENCFPPSYYTLSPKEKLILFYAENFRRQCIAKLKMARPLVLTIPNECHTEKFVSTTIRPTSFIYSNFIDSIDEIASFVADHIAYETLPNPIAIPERLISPAIILKRRCGNSFEMATLLCSMLIGAGFPALVVSGVARHETTLNDQRNIICPYIPEDAELLTNPVKDFDEEIIDEPKCKYHLKPAPDTTNHLDEKLEKLAKARERVKQRIIDEENRARQEILDTLSNDKYHNRRLHAWIVIIENAVWSVKPRKTYIDETGNEVFEKPTAYFIEPSTGFRHSTYSNAYIHVDSIWNNENYYVNCQNCRPRAMEWELNNLEKWTHFLPAEPLESRVRNTVSEENLTEYEKTMTYIEKHLDLIRSWVQKLHISELDFNQRYPNERKVVFYKRCIHERFAPYSETDGKLTQITIYNNHKYETPTIRWITYENRSDFLNKIKIDFRTKDVEETFFKGRPDCLKLYQHGVDLETPKRFYFYYRSRLDSLALVETYRSRLILHYKDRFDKCSYQKYCFKENGMSLLSLTEHMDRNESIPAKTDIAYRKVYLDDKKVFIKFHYNEYAITRNTREFIFPPEPAYGQEYIYDPKLTKGFNVSPTENDPTQYELYQLLLKQLKYRKTIQKRFDSIWDEILGILETRQNENKSYKLEFTVFNRLHNQNARDIRIKKFDAEELRIKLIEVNDPDFLAPYLVPYKDRKLTYDESTAAYTACLYDLKTRFVRLLNGLQIKYEDLTAEYKAIKKFLRKYQEQFDKFDYERWVQQVKDIELNKRMVQQRLEITHEEAQRKYEKVKDQLENDSRLQLKKISIFYAK